MRQRAAFRFLALLCLLMTACGRGEPETTVWTPAQMARAILDAQGVEGMNVEVLRDGDGAFDAYLADGYGLKPEDVADGCILYAGGVSALEVAVLRLADGADREKAVQGLEEYISARAGAFAGYAPEEYAVVEGACAASRGRYAALLICPDPEAAREAFAACFTGGPPPEDFVDGPPAAPEEPVVESPGEPAPAPEEPLEPEDTPAPAVEPETEREEEEPASQPEPEPEEPMPEPEEPAPEPEPEEPAPEPWSYSGQRILDAWNGGGREGLAAQDLAILDALEGIPPLGDETLTDYQRELALHDWMIAWAEYDPGALSSGPQGEPMPDNDNPYGFLTGRKGVCLGYTSTFQLLMDLSGIPCVTVHGTSHAGTAEHAWNLVQLDGEWYAVDVTWDDPVASFQVSEGLAHLYFNVTDEFLRRHDHQWDESAAPAAAGTAWAWRQEGRSL